MNTSKNLFEIIKNHASQKELSWIESKANGSLQSLQTAFVAASRFISKIPIVYPDLINGVNINGWTLDKLTRVYLLTTLENSDKTAYAKTLNTLFETAENNEAVALISALPFLDNPEEWLLRATDAVRTNIGVVFDAIAFQNPYAKLYFSELAWNQLILKCIFNDKPVNKIEGLNERANQELAHSISNLAHERWAAGRNIPAQAWRLVSKFIDDKIFSDIQRLFKSENPNDKIAAALVCSESNLKAAKDELQKYSTLNENIQNLSWKALEA